MPVVRRLAASNVWFTRARAATSSRLCRLAVVEEEQL